LTDKVDPRVAFDEGWATAFAGLVLGTSTYRDSLGPGSDFNFDIATPNPAYPRGWYAESTLQSALFSIGSGLGVGLGGLLQTFAGHYKDTPALASIFSYAYYLKNDQPAFANGIANLLDAQQIGGADIQPFADAETNAPSPTDLPIYQTLGVLGQGGVARVVCSDNIYDYREVHRNALSLRRYLKFSAPFAGNFRFSIEPQSSDGVAGFELLARGAQLAYRQASAANSTLNIVRTLTAGDYVVGVFHGDFLSATVDGSVPRATQCFNVSVQAI
ncbi:MAG TPA: hypothetical protein VLC91_14060, partial [Spongiibacteraceae bacterium]|nr:hypothetical protein [Spongiibacteraceae bacterium]